ncbi:MAG TPA: selenocysteine-specific translation elongation factor, partial [Dehalococcoidales bacterium]|nr:selenocysteine-specific translation elongation factor [Dehalococcoidales bacterium]
MYVLGTAGHIDHGKSALVRALTGIDPDRLAEEKERGMTIDLGFAWLKLPSGREIGIVDVPGHERFVRHMLAGAGGIDIAMLVVAANEGVMPQTREHLAILDLLGVKNGIVVLTKKDLVDGELLSFVQDDLKKLLKDTSLRESPIVAVSSVTREGIPELLNAIDNLLERTAPRRDKGRPRLPIDRVFTVAGAGTVVTGTLIDGTLAVGQEVEIHPSGLKSRLRGLQTHKSQVTTASPGSRVAANLSGLNVEQITRGDVVTNPGWLVPTTLLSARLNVLRDARLPVKHNAEQHIFILAAEATAKIRLLDAEELQPGQSGLVQFTLDRPLPVVDGDRFIIRSTTETLGGGTILEAHAVRLPRNRKEVNDNLNLKEKGSPQELILSALDSRTVVDTDDLEKITAVPSEVLTEALRQMVAAGAVVPVDTSMVASRQGWETLVGEIREILKEFHKHYPIRQGMPKVELGKRLKLGKNVQAILERLIAEKMLV